MFFFDSVFSFINIETLFEMLLKFNIGQIPYLHIFLYMSLQPLFVWLHSVLGKKSSYCLS